MTDEEVDELEDDLGVEIPDHYRDFLTRFPEELSAAKKPSGRLVDFQLLDTRKKIVRANNSIWDALAEQIEDRIVIGEDGGGNCYLIDSDDSDPSVYFWSHETNTIEEVASSILEFGHAVVKRHYTLTPLG